MKNSCTGGGYRADLTTRMATEFEQPLGTYSIPARPTPKRHPESKADRISEGGNEEHPKQLGAKSLPATVVAVRGHFVVGG